ncbi:hypothetical protein [Sphingomonas sp. Leaf208]|nr:hypothetical protein [Sphingomonas sp. Leaf208]
MNTGAAVAVKARQPLDLTLDEINRGFDLMLASESMRSVVAY